MAKENTFDKFRSRVHEGVPLEKSAPKPVQTEPTESTEILTEPDVELPQRFLHRLQSLPRSENVNHRVTTKAHFLPVWTLRTVNRFTSRRQPIGD